MAVPNRTTVINKLIKVLKKHYKPFKAPPMPVIDTLLYACCLENAFAEAADSAFSNLKSVSFDLNEVRVTSVGELAQLMNMLPFPKRAAHNLKRLLQSTFESQYSFDLEHLKKQKLGQAATTLQKFEGSTPFVTNYVVQNALEGHSIPIDRGVLECLFIVGVIDQQEKEKWQTPGLERAIPKNRGVEYFSLLHQLGAELSARPFGPTIKSLLLEIDPHCKDRLPKRPSRKKKVDDAAPPVIETEKSKKSVAGKVAATDDKSKKRADKSEAAKNAAARKSQAKKAKPPAIKKTTKPKKTASSRVKKVTKSKTKTSKRITRRKPK